MKINFLVVILSLVVQSSFGAGLNVSGRILNFPQRPLQRPPPFVRPPPMPHRPPALPLPPIADPIIEMDLPTTVGNGCPTGTVSALLSPDKTILSVIFDQFIAEAGPTHQKLFDLKNCILKIPLRTLNGNFSARIVSVDYRGAAVLPENSNLQIILQDAILGGGRPSSLIMNRERIAGPFSDNFILSVDSLPVVSPRPNQHQWSVCDRSQELNLSARMELSNRNPTQDAMASMDSIDVNTQISIDYKLAWRRCSR